MNNLIASLKINLPAKSVAIVVATAVLLVSLFSQSAWAADPRFNFDPADLKTLSVANRTVNSGWQNNSVAANSGDQVAFQVYYRNGVADTIARNTRVRLTFPTYSQSTISVGVSLGADNAPTVTDSVVINSAVNQRLSVENTNIRWYPDRATNPTIISASSSGSGYVEVNLGDIGPCWPHQGYVTFYASLAPDASTPTPTPTGIADLSIAKTVRNNTSYTSFSESVNAVGNDRVTFQIQVQNIGNFNANNVWASDTLPTGLGYVPGSARLDGVYLSDSLISGGVNIGTLYPGSTRTLSLDANVGSLGTGYNNQTLTNYAYVRADQINERNDSAVVYASQQSPYYPYNPPVYYPTTSSYYYSYLNLTKTVRNITANQTGLAGSTSAQIGDRLLFTIQLNAPTGSYQYNQVSNVRVWDTLPSGLSYVVNTSRLDNGWISDSLVTTGVNIGTIFGSQTKTLTFEATVNSYGGSQTMTNYAYVAGDGISQQSAFAQINTAFAQPAPVYTPVTYTPQPVEPQPVVKGAAIAAVTGGNELARNIAVALMIALWGIFLIYFYMEYLPAVNWNKMKFKYAIWKIRMKEKVM